MLLSLLNPVLILLAAPFLKYINVCTIYTITTKPLFTHIEEMVLVIVSIIIIII